MLTQGMATRLVIDEEDRIRSTCERWDDFARSNGAPDACRAAIEGQPLWTFIAGREIVHLYQLLLDRVRATGVPVRLPFRCDSPTARRYMGLEIRPGAPGRLEIESVLLREEPRPAVELLDPFHRRGDERVRMCSWCKRVEVGTSWLEVEEAIAALDLFAGAMPQLSHGICSGCDAAVRDELASGGEA